VDADGFLDLYTVQNFYGPQRESGYLDGGVSLLLKGTGSGEFIPVGADVSGLVVPGDATSLVAADLNGDAQVDFVVGKNNDHPQVFFGQPHSKENASVVPKPISVPELAEGREMIGAKIHLLLPNGQQRLHEVFAGQGYLSQTPLLIFGGGKVKKMEWPEPVTVGQ